MQIRLTLPPLCYIRSAGKKPGKAALCSLFSKEGIPRKNVRHLAFYNNKSETYTGYDSFLAYPPITAMIFRRKAAPGSVSATLKFTQQLLSPVKYTSVKRGLIC